MCTVGERDSLGQKLFIFEDDGICGVPLTVKIPEMADPSYGMYTWACAPVLAHYVWKQRTYIHGKRVLEIGSGTALAGIVAAKCGGDVTLSDSAIFQDCLENSRRSCQANDLQNVKVVSLTWGLMTPTLLQLPPVDIILGSDCFYDTKDFEDVLVTVSFMMKRNPNCQFWTTYQKRSTMRSIEFLLTKWGLAAKEVQVSEFFNTSDEQYKDYPSINSVHMFIITLDKENATNSAVT